MKKLFSGITILGMLASQFFVMDPIMAFVSGNLQMVINEVAWGGSKDSANDEYIELYNNSEQDVDLTGWQINDDNGADLYKLSGIVAPKSYYLIERNEAATSVQSDLVVSGMSLSNTGDSLVLLDASGAAVDSVNSSGGAWPSGDYAKRASMERMSAEVSGDDATNWFVSSGNIATASKQSAITGTPKAQNSVPQNLDSTNNQNNESLKQYVFLNSASATVGTTYKIDFNVKNVSTLFSYGLEVNYDPQILKFEAAVKGNFLDENGDIDTSFESGLKDSIEGKIYIAEARTQTVKTGRSGDGTLFSLNFKVLKTASNSKVSFGASSFLASVTGDINNSFVDFTFSTGVPVQTQQTAEEVLTSPGWFKFMDSESRFAIKLQWEKKGNFVYKIYKKNHKGTYRLIGQTSEDSFTDNDSVKDGGKIVPKIKYDYKVVATLGSQEAEGLELTASDERGIKGDADRSDVVDGRDLNLIAKKFGSNFGDADFDYALDFNFDGKIDGVDLIELGSNFAKSYK